jgi:hypothetical protein
MICLFAICHARIQPPRQRSGLNSVPGGEDARGRTSRQACRRSSFAPIDKTEVALVASPDASPATLRLADRLAEFCHTVQAKAA